MEEPKKPVRVRIEAPVSEKLEKLPKREKESLSIFYYTLLFFSYVFSFMSLYLSFVL